MSIKVKLKDIIEGMELQFEDSSSLLNIETGEIVVVTSEDIRAAEVDEPFDHLPDWQQENRLSAIDVVENYEKYIELPTKYDVNEYKIMEDFCLSIRDERKQDLLLRSINGKGAFRRFKDTIIDLRLDDQWYGYRNDCFKQIVINWCQTNNVDYSE